MALLSQIPRLGGLKGINNLNGLNGPLNLQWMVDEKSAQKNATSRKFRKKKLPQNLDAEINTTAPPSAHPKLSPYKSSIDNFCRI